MNNEIGLKRYGNIYGDNFSTSFAGNVYDTNGLCPAIKCEGGGGNRLPMILEETDMNDINENRVGNLNNHSGGSFAYQVYKTDGVAPTLTRIGDGGGREPFIIEDYYSCAVRGRYTDDGKTEQQLEINNTETINNITSVAKDSLIMEKVKVEKQQGYRIRKITPRESFRLMNISEEDYEKAQLVNSKTQLLKEAGNSIVVNCLVAIFGQMFEGHENDYIKFANTLQY